MRTYQKLALVKRVYDINLNYLGVRRTESGVRREERRRKRNRRRNRALIRTWYHTSNYQRPKA
ncbi:MULTISPECIES: hypothetical protein [unclassified Okeania]|uniref:hypothetical protein n=1 Tax=unclassified Okeania TaxID=2634635 RepID=UPI0013BB3664|nr:MULTISPECIES: hypothetical protein [unclassified Okeania]NET21485.1 hypothetical protein [Okeania sp. SIO1H5]NET94278.1 hypothetical protein [Okeania sp. SIO1H2]